MELCSSRSKFKRYRQTSRKKVNNIAEYKDRFHINAMQIVSDGPNYQTRTIRDCFLNLIMSAKRSIYIETPYFVPDDLLLDCLRIAIRSGIEVKIIVPYVGDHLFVYWANQAFIMELSEIESRNFTDILTEFPTANL